MRIYFKEYMGLVILLMMALVMALAVFSHGAEIVNNQDDVAVSQSTITVKAHTVRPFERFTVDSLNVGDTLVVRATVNSVAVYRLKYVVKQAPEGVLRALVKVECSDGN
ncbi:hypothetical protein CCP3SC15_1550003 [Gammaproteobacteria bacterium]